MHQTAIKQAPMFLALWALLALSAQAQQKNPPAVDLGYFLYHDTRLSEDNNTSCASCHALDKGTSDGLPLGVGRIGSVVNGRSFPHGIKGNKRTPPTLNAALIPSQRRDGLPPMFWDGRGNGLASQASGPIENPDEMGSQSIGFIARRLNRIAGYRLKMQAAFGTPEVTPDRITAAIAAFEKQRLVATDTLLARHLKGEPTVLSESAKRGALVFKQHCTSCHPAPLFTSGQFVNTGIEYLYGNRDRGYGLTTGRPSDDRKYKVPSLVAVSIRQPYSHLGVLPTLEHVIEHYSRGAVVKERRDPLLDSRIRPLQLSADAKRDLKSCLVEGLMPLDYPTFQVPTEFPR